VLALAFERPQLLLNAGDISPAAIGLIIALLVLSLGIHEAAHGWVANRCGDPTAKDLGRITLNPAAHIDPFMTVLLPLVLFYSAGFVFGGAKPVPVAFHRLRRPYRDMALVALAGPLSNFLLAGFFLVCWWLVVNVTQVWSADMDGPKVLGAAVGLNLLLAAFNLAPVPPLDGSRVMAWLLPENLRKPYHSLENLGLFLVFFLVFFVPGFQQLIGQMMVLMYRALEYPLTLGGLW